MVFLLLANKSLQSLYTFSNYSFQDWKETYINPNYSKIFTEKIVEQVGNFFFLN